MYRLSADQISHCKDFIRSGYRLKKVSRAQRTRFEKILSKPDSPRALSVYIAIQALGPPDRDEAFCAILPQPIESYTVPDSVLDIFSSEPLYPEDLLPRDSSNDPIGINMSVEDSSPKNHQLSFTESSKLEKVKTRQRARAPKKLYSFQVDEPDLEELKIRAELEGRTVSGTLRMLIKQYLRS